MASGCTAFWRVLVSQITSWTLPASTLIAELVGLRRTGSTLKHCCAH